MILKPSVSVLASFDVEHFGSSHSPWPEKLFPNVEIYAFMHNCLLKLFGVPASGREYSTLRVLAEASKDLEAPSRIADAIHQHFHNARIPAISTYLPEITAPEDSENWKAAQSALGFLVITAAELRKRGHPCTVLEMVGGSSVDGLWLGEDVDRDKVYVVNRVGMELAIARLMTRLTPVAELALEHGVRLALEMEPGPLFSIGDWRSLLMFCSALEADKGSLNSVVGLNLDIAHWALLSGISTDAVRQNPCVLNRIIHAHISDHSRGHCSDAIPSMFHSAEEFLPWCRLLVDIMNSRPPNGPNGLPYSGYISCELESAYDVESVRLATMIVQHWFDYCC
jgi:sugar phosphate isomerase/epimerase